MTIWQLLTVSAAVVGLVILVVMAAIPFLTDERGRATGGSLTGQHRHALGPRPHPPHEAA